MGQTNNILIKKNPHCDENTLTLNLSTCFDVIHMSLYDLTSVVEMLC